MVVAVGDRLGVLVLEVGEQPGEVGAGVPLVTRIQDETALTGAPHLTCVGASRGEILDIARGYWDQGVRHLVALRGDPPQGTAQCQPHAQGFAYAADLVAALARLAPFDISVAAYPEVHPEAVSAQADLDNLKRKIDAGATRAITQFFYDTGLSCASAIAATAAGIRAPIVPGILPITRFPQVCRFAERCGAAIPAWLRARFRGPRRRCRDPPPDRRQCRYRAGAGADSPWRRASFISIRSIAPS